MRRLGRRLVVIVAAVAPVILAASAWAGTPSQVEYQDVLATKSQGAGGTLGVIDAGQSGGLPFTGLELLPIVAVAVGLIVLGLVLRRSRRRTS